MGHLFIQKKILFSRRTSKNLKSQIIVCNFYNFGCVLTISCQYQKKSYIFSFSYVFIPSRTRITSERRSIINAKKSQIHEYKVKTGISEMWTMNNHEKKSICAFLFDFMAFCVLREILVWLYFMCITLFYKQKSTWDVFRFWLLFCIRASSDSGQNVK